MDKITAIRLLDASDVEACVEVVWMSVPATDAELVGKISGPRVEGSRTLPATIALRPLSNTAAPAAEAVLPDPCYWSPERPFLYDVSLELRRGNEVVDSAAFSIALHRKRVVKQ